MSLLKERVVVEGCDGLGFERWWVIEGGFYIWEVMVILC